MYRFDGISRASLRPAPILNWLDFTLSLWVRTNGEFQPSGNNGTIFGGQYITRYLRCDLHADGDFNESYGSLAFGIQPGLRKKIVTCDASPIDDGQLHHLAIVRDGTDIRIYFDGTEQALTVAADNLLANTTITVAAGLGAGALRDLVSWANHLEVDVGGFAMWPSSLSDAQITRLAAGFSPRLIETLPEWYWPAFSPSEDIGGLTWTDSLLHTGIWLAPEHPAITHANAIVDEQLNPDRLGGYYVYLKAGTAATVGVDRPIARVDRDTTALAIDVADLDLAPLTSYCLSVVAADKQGLSDAVHTWFRTDATGTPVYLPSPVTALRAQPLAGGAVRITWQYAEREHGRQVADEFRMEFERLDGSPDPDPITIPRPSLAGSFAKELTLDEGQYRVRVLSRLGGLANEAVGWNSFITDASAPVEGLAGIEAN